MTLTLSSCVTLDKSHNCSVPLFLIFKLCLRSPPQLGCLAPSAQVVTLLWYLAQSDINVIKVFSVIETKTIISCYFHLLNIYLIKRRRIGKKTRNIPQFHFLDGVSLACCRIQYLEKTTKGKTETPAPTRLPQLHSPNATSTDSFL